MQPITTLRDGARSIGNATSTATGMARDTFYAGLGILSVLQEEAERAFDNLVSEGRRVETGHARNLTAKVYREARDEAREVRVETMEAAQEVEEVVEAAEKKAEARRQEFEKRLSEMVTDALQRMNVPTRADVDALKRAVERLEKKTLELRAA